MAIPFSLTPLQHYIEQQDTPICAYYYDLDHLMQRIRWIMNELPEGVRFYYAIKANSDIPVLRTLAPHIYGFEVASLGEIHKARQANPDSPIAFGGPGKTQVELQGALEAGVELYHIESSLQLMRLNALAAERGRPVKVLLRINYRFDLPNATLQMTGKATQFGIDQAQVSDILQALPNYPYIQCLGFHFHTLSNNLDAESQLSLIHNYIKVTLAWQRQYGLSIEVLNVGGGIGINYAPSGPQFNWAHYCRGLEQLINDSKLGFEIAMECGRFVSATAGCYVTEVTDIKTNHGENFAILRGGSHQFRLPSSWQHDHPFSVMPVEQWTWPYARPGIVEQDITLCGELCTPKDVLARKIKVERLRVGDLVVFEKTGAYGWHISHHDFLSHPHPERIYFQDERLLSAANYL